MHEDARPPPSCLSLKEEGDLFEEIVDGRRVQIMEERLGFPVLGIHSRCQSGRQRAPDDVAVGVPEDTPLGGVRERRVRPALKFDAVEALARSAVLGKRLCDANQRSHEGRMAGKIAPVKRRPRTLRSVGPGTVLRPMVTNEFPTRRFHLRPRS